MLEQVGGLYTGPSETEKDTSRQHAELAPEDAAEVAYQVAITRELVSDECDRDFDGPQGFITSGTWNGSLWGPNLPK